MNILVPFLGRDPHALISVLRDLATDLERIASSQEPTVEMLSRAPVLADWRFCPRLVPALEAVISTGARGSTGRERRISSELFVIDTVGGWCRTRDRFYRLAERG